MNKSKVVADLVTMIAHQRLLGRSNPEIRQLLIAQGWAIGAVQEAFVSAP